MSIAIVSLRAWYLALRLVVVVVVVVVAHLGAVVAKVHLFVAIIGVVAKVLVSLALEPSNVSAVGPVLGPNIAQGVRRVVGTDNTTSLGSQTRMDKGAFQCMLHLGMSRLQRCVAEAQMHANAEPKG